MKRLWIYLVSVLAILCSCNINGDDIELSLVNPEQMESSCSSDYQTVWITFDCNRSWTAAASADWIELEPSSGQKGEGLSLGAVVSGNTDTEYRTAEITITAGEKTLVVTLRQAPVFKDFIWENFDADDLLLEGEIPSGWHNIDEDADGHCWRVYKDPETEVAFAYSTSYIEGTDRALTPDNWLTSPRFVLRGKGFKVKWDAMGSDPEYLGDKYQVWVAAYQDGSPLVLYEKICEEETVSATELTHHEFNLDLYVDLTICIAFRHFDSVGRSRVLITNVEVSNR